jgi:hypothetical protein
MSITEPIYTYVKGEGWVARSSITMACGTEVTFECRPPRQGERYKRYLLNDPPPDLTRLEFEHISTARSLDEDYIKMSERWNFLAVTRVE